MKTNPEKVIREACIKANPEIMELKFGCICSGKYASESNPNKYYYSNGTLGGGFSIKTGQKVSYRNSPMPDGSSSIEIIGRPIRLADVLLAYSFHKKMYLQWGAMSGDRMAPYEAEIINIVAKWNYKDDDLSLQSDETKEFLATLL